MLQRKLGAGGVSDTLSSVKRSIFRGKGWKTLCGVRRTINGVLCAFPNMKEYAKSECE